MHFMSHGLRVEIIEYDEVARNLGKESTPDHHENVLFVAEQLQFSDDQVNNISCVGIFSNAIPVSKSRRRIRRSFFVFS